MIAGVGWICDIEENFVGYCEVLFLTKFLFNCPEICKLEFSQFTQFIHKGFERGIRYEAGSLPIFCDKKYKI